MKRPHLSLYGQILFWFFLNLALVAAVLFVVLRVQFRVDATSVLGGRTHEQFRAAGTLLASELRNAPRDEWREIIARYDETYGVQFAVYRPNGNGVLAGEELELPENVITELRSSFPRRSLRDGEPNPRRGRDPRGRGPREEGPRGDGPPRGEGRRGDGPRGPRRPPRDVIDELLGPPSFLDEGEPEPASEGSTDGDRIVRVFFVGTGGDPERHWAVGMGSLANRTYRHPPDAVIVASSSSLSGNEIFFDWRPWIWALIVVLLVSALIWLPFVGRVSRRLRRLTTAAESISEGDFDVSVASERHDELGRLSRAVQRMANRLDDYLAGQKRFLGDIAHELCSPLARLRMSVGLLENRLPTESHGTLTSVNEEAEELSQLINELLDFSRASIAPSALPRHDVEVANLLEEVAEREGQGAAFEIEVDPELTIATNRDLLRRALANVVRNASRYAGTAGPIELRASKRGQETVLQVKDRGPGIPDEWLEKVFEPFSRPERARTREGGGAGLGLAIARTCISGLQGKIRARNREGGGLSVELAIPINEGEQ